MHLHDIPTDVGQLLVSGILLVSEILSIVDIGTPVDTTCADLPDIHFSFYAGKKYAFE